MLITRPARRAPLRSRPLGLLQFDETTDALLRAADRNEAAFRRALLEAFAGASSVPLSELEALIEQGDTEALADRLIAAIGVLFLTAAIADALAASAASAASTTVASTPVQDTPFAPPGTPPSAEIAQTVSRRLDRRSALIQGFARNYAAGLVTNITDGVRETVRALVTDALVTNADPRALARQLRDVVGLTARDARAVARYEAGLLAQGVPPARGREQSQRYSERLLRNRATTISRTELMNAIHNGQQMAWQQLITAGVLDATRIRRRWLTAHDERTCPVCKPLDGQVVGFSQPFDVGGTRLMNPPAHPRCRCTVVLVEEPTPLVFHLAGKHNQKHHGRRMKGGVKSQKNERGEWEPVDAPKSAGVTQRAKAASSAATDRSHEEMIRESADWWRSLSEDQQDTISYYGATGYRPMNGHLRTGEDIDAEDIALIGELQGVLSHPLGADTAVYRGIGIEGDLEALVGEVLTDKGFVSTSLRRQQGERFASFRQEEYDYENPRGKTAAVARIAVPKGARVGYLGNQPGRMATEEAEVLLPPGGSFLVSGVTFGDTYPVVDLVYVPVETS